MSKKKKIDLSKELADLIMGDESDTSLSETRASTRVISEEDTAKNKNVDIDPDPTLAIAKTTTQSEEQKSKSSNSEGTIEIDSNKTVVGISIQRGIGARTEDINKPDESSDENSESLNAEETNWGEQTKSSISEEVSQFFSPIEKAQHVTSVYKNASSTNKRTSTELLLTAEASLVQSDQLRIAQERILGLERNVEELRSENEELVAVGETLRNRADDLKSQLEQIQLGTKEKSDIYNEELVVLQTSLLTKNDEIARLKMKTEELESRLSGDLRKVRVRERELENRLELIKLESQAVIKNKDEVALDLKRKIDQLNYELENHRVKGKDLNRTIEDNRERIRRTVKALRLALSMLEGEEQDAQHLKKAE